MDEQWRSSNEGTLPSFYSPRTRPRPVAQPQDPQSQPSAVDNDEDVPVAALRDQDEDEDEDENQPPPPSLLSPSFTPPSTPGTATPHNQSAAARAIPVDSSLPDAASNCGPSRPRLVARLPHVECIVRARIPTVTGTEMFLHLYTNDVDNKEHLAIVFGAETIRSKSLDAPRPGETETDRMVRGAYVGRLYPGRTTSGMETLKGTASSGHSQQQKQQQPQETLKQAQTQADIPLVRIHSECYTGETAWSARCDCGEQLDEAARLMSLPENKAGGIIIYLRQEGRGIGLGEKLKAYNLQDLGSDTVEANLLLRHPADARSYGLATAMLLDLGQKEIRLLTNNPDKIRAVEGPNREIVVKERVEMVPLSWRGKGGFRSKEVEGYLKTKVSFMPLLLASDRRRDMSSHTDWTVLCRLRRWATCWTWTLYPVNSCPTQYIYCATVSYFFFPTSLPSAQCHQSGRYIKGGFGSLRAVPYPSKSGANAEPQVLLTPRQTWARRGPDVGGPDGEGR